jgi:hypothetical protein
MLTMSRRNVPTPYMVPPRCFPPSSPFSSPPMSESVSSWIEEKSQLPPRPRHLRWSHTSLNGRMTWFRPATNIVPLSSVSTVPETSLIQMSVILASGRDLSTTNDDPLELQRRSIHLDVEKRQQARANGVLSGNGRLSRHHSVVTDIQISDRHRHIHLESRPRGSHCHYPPCIQDLGSRVRMEPASSHPRCVHE